MEVKEAFLVNNTDVRLWLPPPRQRLNRSAADEKEIVIIGAVKSASTEGSSIAGVTVSYGGHAEFHKDSVCKGDYGL